MKGEAFAKLYGQLYPELLRYAQRTVGRQDAEDVLASAFLTMWRKDLATPQSSEEDRRLRALAYEVLRGQILNDRRAAGRRTALRDRIAALRHLAPIDPDHPEDSVEEILRQLPAGDRDVVLLFHAGFSTAEIAQILRLSVTAAQKRQARAKARLREILKDREEER